MWSRISILMLAALVVTACGFEPIYGDATRDSYGASTTEDTLSKIAIGNIPDEEGQILRNALMDRFYRHGRPAAPSYQLRVAPLQEQTANLDVTIESETTRRQIRMTTSFALIDTSTQEAVLQRPVHAISSYNVLGSQFTTLVTERDTKEAVLNDIARQIEDQISLYIRK